MLTPPMSGELERAVGLSIALVLRDHVPASVMSEADLIAACKAKIAFLTGLTDAQKEVYGNAYEANAHLVLAP